MASVVVVDIDLLQAHNGIKDLSFLYEKLPPKTKILKMWENFIDYSLSVLVEYDFVWCVSRVSGNRGDLVGADFDFNEDAI